MRFPFEQHVAAWGSRRLFRLSVLLAAAALAAIYLFSLQSPVQSLMLSGRFSRLLLRLTGRQFDEHLLRKLAHVAEYALLGMLAGLALAQTDWGARQAFKLLLAGMLAAFLDESLQLLSGRGASILDVWIDTLGVMAGLAVILAFFSPRRPPPAS
ncbi:MAG TPA: VanZ family protein [Clostridia bacterium]|nr:VanZ family protein [Clostridia bacterium]